MSSLQRFQDVGWLLLVIVICPIAIVIVGLPVVLLVRLLMTIVDHI